MQYFKSVVIMEIGDSAVINMNEHVDVTAIPVGTIPDGAGGFFI